ncbi:MULTISPECIES: FUSC family protein [unclassified Leucobacter]|uniref:FUSC family protein n=1 Tax=unclassified Leucobacter TaxID=2621730 RepID=UPI001F1455BC|nr:MULTISPECIES: FUSC family protein [unclassified Leucobacter]
MMEQDPQPRTSALQIVGRATRSLLELPPSPGPRTWIALRAALSVSLPFGALTLLGHPEIGLQTAAGAFVALYAAGMGAAERAKVLPFVAAALIACTALGALLAPWPILLAIGLVGVTVVASALCFAYRVGPPGSVFFALAFGLSANITAVVDGERLNSPVTLMLAVSGGALFSYALALAPLLRRAERARPVRPVDELLPGPWLGAGERELLARVAVVAVLGTAVSVIWIDPHRAYWTVTAGVAVVGLVAGRRHAIGRGLHRTVGTLIGAGLYLAIAPLGRIPLLLVLLLGILQFAVESVVVRNYALALVFITPLVLLISGAATGGGDLWGSALERFLDTAVGVAIAMLTGLIHRRSAPRAYR